MKTARPAPAAPLVTPEDGVMLDRLQHHAFNYFLAHTNLANGLVADTSRPDSPSSIATVGFALSCYPVGVERGRMERQDAVQRTLAALRFFHHSDQSGTPKSTGYHGFYYHFLHMDSGTRTWACEVSLIDTALLLAGMLTAAAYFTGSDLAETELRELAHALYRRVDWPWAQHGGAAVGGLASQGWSQVPRKLANRMRGTEELTLENEVLLLLAGSLLRLCAALEQRGHAALETLHVGTEAAGSAALDAITELVANLSPARSYPHWELSAKAKPDADPRRVRLVERVAQQLRRALAANGAAWTGQPHG